MKTLKKYSALKLSAIIGASALLAAGYGIALAADNDANGGMNPVTDNPAVSQNVGLQADRDDLDQEAKTNNNGALNGDINKRIMDNNGRDFNRDDNRFLNNGRNFNRDDFRRFERDHNINRGIGFRRFDRDDFRRLGGNWMNFHRYDWDYYWRNLYYTNYRLWLYYYYLIYYSPYYNYVPPIYGVQAYNYSTPNCGCGYGY